MNDTAISLFPYCDDSWNILCPAIRHLTREQLAWCFPGNPTTIGWLLDHVASTEDYWISEIAFREALAVSEETDMGDINALLAKHQYIRERSKERLRSLKLTDMQRVCQVPEFADGWKPLHPATLHWVFTHVFSHETYHIGHLVILLRLQGLSEPHF